MTALKYVSWLFSTYYPAFNTEISSDKESLQVQAFVPRRTQQKWLQIRPIIYNETPHAIAQIGRNRQRNITCFNPSLSRNVKTNVGKRFLSLIDHHFPKTNPLHKIFNCNTHEQLKLKSANHQNLPRNGKQLQQPKQTLLLTKLFVCMKRQTWKFYPTSLLKCERYS